MYNRFKLPVTWISTVKEQVPFKQHDDVMADITCYLANNTADNMCIRKTCVLKRFTF